MNAIFYSKIIEKYIGNDLSFQEFLVWETLLTLFPFFYFLKKF